MSRGAGLSLRAGAPFPFAELEMVLLDRIGRLLAFVLVAATLAGPGAAAPREDMLAPLCAGDFGAQKAALEEIARAGVAGSDAEAEHIMVQTARLS